MIDVIPILPIYKGKIAKSERGDFENIRQYDAFPLEIAKRLEDHGVRRINLVDLEGAKKGSIINYEALEILAKHTQLEIDFSGGVTSDGNIRLAFENGANFITSASVAVLNPELFHAWIISYGRNKIILAADALEKNIRIRGWSKKTNLDILHHIEYYYERGIKYVKCTDIGADGQLKGPSLDFFKDIRKAFPDIILLASGGIRSLEDVLRLEEIGVTGALIATAIFENKIKFEELEN